MRASATSASAPSDGSGRDSGAGPLPFGARWGAGRPPLLANQRFIQVFGGGTSLGFRSVIIQASLIWAGGPSGGLVRVRGINRGTVLANGGGRRAAGPRTGGGWPGRWGLRPRLPSGPRGGGVPGRPRPWG